MSESRKKTIQKLIQETKKVKEHLNLVVIGHVDAGKSTIMGHLLYLSGNVTKKEMHQFEQESKNKGKNSLSFAWVLDKHPEERYL